MHWKITTLKSFNQLNMNTMLLTQKEKSVCEYVPAEMIFIIGHMQHVCD